MAIRFLTELEGCVLGELWAEGPCTAYAVRQQFRASPSPHWSGSAGAIYPLLFRLEQRRLVQSKAAHTGRRASKLYHVTTRGRHALRRWIGPKVSEWVAGVPADPLRTRLRFLGALSPRARAQFLDDAESQVQYQLQLVEKDCERTRTGDRYEHLMAEGACAVLRARLEWVGKIATLERAKTANA